MTGNKETAEDLVQDTFLAAFNGFQNFKGESNPLTWLLAILNRKIVDYHRQQYRLRSNGLPGQNEANTGVLYDTFVDKNGK